MKFVKPKTDNLTIEKINEDGSFAYFSSSFFIRQVFIKRLQEALNLIDENQPIKRILDIGTGCGYLLPSLAQLNQEVYALDKDIMYLKKAEEISFNNQLSPYFINSGIYGLPFKNKSFQLIFCLSVLEHLREIGPTLREIDRIMDEQGILIVGVPVERFLVNTLFKSLDFVKSAIEKKLHFKDLGGRYQDVHFTDFSIIEKKLKRTFKVTEVKTIPSSDFFPIPSAFLLYRLYKCQKK